jgi:streptogramin lyase
MRNPMAARMAVPARMQRALSGSGYLVAFGVLSALAAVLALVGLGVVITHRGLPRDVMAQPLKVAFFAAVVISLLSVAGQYGVTLFGSGRRGTEASRGIVPPAMTGASVGMLILSLAGLLGFVLAPQAGILREYALPSANSQPLGITLGPDGNLWFTEAATSRIGSISPSGTIHEYQLPLASAPSAIVAGPSRTVWFTVATGYIGRISPDGSVQEYQLPRTNSQPLGITAGPDGNLWFTDAATGHIGRITPSGAIHEFSLLDLKANSTTAKPVPAAITLGPDGNLWFTLIGESRIGRISPTGGTSLYPVPNRDGRMPGIAGGPDGYLWFTCNESGRIGRMAS